MTQPTDSLKAVMRKNRALKEMVNQARSSQEGSVRGGRNVIYPRTFAIKFHTSLRHLQCILRAQMIDTDTHSGDIFVMEKQI